jgi:DNA-binding NarL/FixJ family response regulator
MAPELHLASAPVAADSHPPRSRIRVVLADDHALMRHGLRLTLDGERDVEVAAEADDMSCAIRQVHLCKPHVLVLDLRMRGGSSVDTIAEMRERVPDTKVVVLSMNDSPAFARHALAAGALGFVLKDLADSELPAAVRAAARGERYVSPRVAARMDAVNRSVRGLVEEAGW